MNAREAKEMDKRKVAWDREETEPCERGTVGCSIDHTAEDATAHSEHGCETW